MFNYLHLRSGVQVNTISLTERKLTGESITSTTNVNKQKHIIKDVVVDAVFPPFSDFCVQYRRTPLEETLAVWSEPSTSSAGTRSGP